MSRFIVKVQVSLNTPEDSRLVLVYNQDRSVWCQYPFAGFEALMADLDPELLKGFFWASQDKEGLLHIDEKTDWRDW